MMSESPLELYSRAYNLQYEQNKVGEACVIYKDIVNNFPDSNECAYAAIQLEKVGASEVARKLKVKSRGAGPVVVVLLVINFAGLLAAGGLGLYKFRQIDRRLNRSSQTIRKLSEEALEMRWSLSQKADSLENSGEK
ncbi:MAG: hypothetical protein GF350_08150 [Chitinivibrionales bacterium]|nr:hypothetical protein [Chitinivibrionales bacterium]